MELLTCRADQDDKRFDAADARMARIEGKLADIQLTLAGPPTQGTVLGWGIAVITVVVATGLSVGAIVLQTSGNQLSAFQAGLSAIQAVAAAGQMAPPPARPAR